MIVTHKRRKCTELNEPEFEISPIAELSINIRSFLDLVYSKPLQIFEFEPIQDRSDVAHVI